MNQISQVLQSENYGRAFRCFAVYNTARGEMIFVLKRGCSKSFQESYQKVMLHADTNLKETIKTGFYIQCATRSEWHGILNEQTKCFFLMMCFPATNAELTKQTINQLKAQIEQYPGYENLSRQDLESKMKAECAKIIHQMEEKYLEKQGPEGEPSDDEESLGRLYKRVEAGKSKIEASSNINKSNQNLQQKSEKKPQSQNESKALQQSQQSQQQLSQQQQQQQQQKQQINKQPQFVSQFNPPDSGILQNSGNIKQTKNTVYRCFAIYCLKDKDLTFILKRGCNKSYLATVEKLRKDLSSSENKLNFYMQGTNKVEWHGILDEKKQCYFLMMTFSGSQQGLVYQTLKDIKQHYSTQQFENIGQSSIHQKMMGEITQMVDQFELEYVQKNKGVGEGNPSDDEIGFVQSSGLNPPKFSGTITNFHPFAGLPELTYDQMLEQLKNFKPATQQSDKIVLVSSLVLIIVFLIGLVSIYI